MKMYRIIASLFLMQHVMGSQIKNDVLHKKPYKILTGNLGQDLDLVSKIKSEIPNVQNIIGVTRDSYRIMKGCERAVHKIMQEQERIKGSIGVLQNNLLYSQFQLENAFIQKEIYDGIYNGLLSSPEEHVYFRHIGQLLHYHSNFNSVVQKYLETQKPSQEYLEEVYRSLNWFKSGLYQSLKPFRADHSYFLRDLVMLTDLKIYSYPSELEKKQYLQDYYQINVDENDSLSDFIQGLELYFSLFQTEAIAPGTFLSQITTLQGVCNQRFQEISDLTKSYQYLEYEEQDIQNKKGLYQSLHQQVVSHHDRLQRSALSIQRLIRVVQAYKLVQRLQDEKHAELEKLRKQEKQKEEKLKRLQEQYDQKAEYAATFLQMVQEQQMHIAQNEINQRKIESQAMKQEDQFAKSLQRIERLQAAKKCKQDEQAQLKAEKRAQEKEKQAILNRKKDGVFIAEIVNQLLHCTMQEVYNRQQKLAEIAAQGVIAAVKENNCLDRLPEEVITLPQDNDNLKSEVHIVVNDCLTLSPYEQFLKDRDVVRNRRIEIEQQMASKLAQLNNSHKPLLKKKSEKASIEKASRRKLAEFDEKDGGLKFKQLLEKYKNFIVYNEFIDIEIAAFNLCKKGLWTCHQDLQKQKLHLGWFLSLYPDIDQQISDRYQQLTKEIDADMITQNHLVENLRMYQAYIKNMKDEIEKNLTLPNGYQEKLQDLKNIHQATQADLIKLQKKMMMYQAMEQLHGPQGILNTQYAKNLKEDELQNPNTCSNQSSIPLVMTYEFSKKTADIVTKIMQRQGLRLASSEQDLQSRGKEDEIIIEQAQHSLQIVLDALFSENYDTIKNKLESQTVDDAFHKYIGTKIQYVFRQIGLDKHPSLSKEISQSAWSISQIEDFRLGDLDIELFPRLKATFGKVYSDRQLHAMIDIQIKLIQFYQKILYSQNLHKKEQDSC